MVSRFMLVFMSQNRIPCKITSKCNFICVSVLIRGCIPWYLIFLKQSQDNINCIWKSEWKRQPERERERRKSSWFCWGGEMKRRENISEMKDVSEIAFPSWWSGTSPTKRVTQTRSLFCFVLFFFSYPHYPTPLSLSASYCHWGTKVRLDVVSKVQQSEGKFKSVKVSASCCFCRWD